MILIKKYFWLLTTITIFFMVMLIAIITFDNISLAFPIQNVIVKGELTHIDYDKLQSAVRPLVTRYNWFNIDLYAIRSLINQPWIDFVQVSRVFPDTIVIRIYAKKAQAIWQKRGIVDAFGEVFYPHHKRDDLPKNLPYFAVVDVAPKKGSLVSLSVLRYYRQMLAVLMPLGFGIRKIQLNLDKFWQVYLIDKQANQMELRFDKDDMLTELHRFAIVYPKVFATSKRKASVVDLRYERGMAVKWRKRKH